MEPDELAERRTPVDFAAAFGAEAGVAVQCFTIYISNKDKEDEETGSQRRWVLDGTGNKPGRGCFRVR